MTVREDAFRAFVKLYPSVNSRATEGVLKQRDLRMMFIEGYEKGFENAARLLTDLPKKKR